ncbi:hypothetical protein PR048_030276 [Dryococelus australis]|uniref:Uncharacterized protein n=1 Tax=Dryococelus australis TaxID=614101 RepID=A0ABQ9GB58_9NEOP|nr:hypothetical protein PR048_030276 [Dryococelus australis]
MSPPLYAYILTGALSDMHPMKLVTVEGKSNLKQRIASTDQELNNMMSWPDVVVPDSKENHNSTQAAFQEQMAIFRTQSIKPNKATGGGGGTVAERSARSPPTEGNRAQSPAGPPDSRKWESLRTMPLVGGSSRGTPASPPPPFRRCTIFTSITLIGSQNLAGLETPGALYTSHVPGASVCFVTNRGRHRGDKFCQLFPSLTQTCHSRVDIPLRRHVLRTRNQSAPEAPTSLSARDLMASPSRVLRPAQRGQKHRVEQKGRSWLDPDTLCVGAEKARPIYHFGISFGIWALLRTRS